MIYDIIDDILLKAIGPSAGFQELVQPAPYAVSSEFLKLRLDRTQTMHEFFNTSIKILQLALDRKLPDEILDLLLGDAAPEFDINTMRSLPEELLYPPLFCRTDESATGKVMEFQCPGSGWGDAEMLAQAYRAMGQTVADSSSSRYIEAVQKLTGKDHPSVLQLLDSASAPVGMRYLIATTRPALRYWGYDTNVDWGHCDLVRAHTPFALLGENQIDKRLKQVQAGETLLDPPYNVLFAQKATLALPFHPVTRKFFSDQVREMIAYSAVLTPEGFYDEQGKFISIDEFLNRPSKQRRWFLKYSGSDIGMSWGGKSVFRLDSTDARKRIEHALSFGTGRWILQPEVTNKEEVQYVDRGDGKLKHEHMYVKFSTFYGPDSVIAIRSMHRKHFKIHGQKDTVIGLVAINTSHTEVTKNKNG